MSTDDTLPWTTSRCNRLLRPLSSKLTKLRKEVQRPSLASAEPRTASSAFATKRSPQKTTNFTRPANKPRGFEKATDPDWRPGAKPGAGKKTTYGGRRKARVSDSRRAGSDVGNGSRPGEIAFTPLISRMGQQFYSSPQAPISPLRKYAKNRGPLLVPIAASLFADLRKLVHGLLEAYAHLLQATAPSGERKRKGTRSLMSACLRNLPAYIELEEHFVIQDKLHEDVEDEDRDIANEIYEHLESHFEQGHGRGWRPFKQVVRAHATALICDAIADEVLGLENILMLVTHCENASAWDEAEQLLLAYAPLLESATMPINTRADLFDAQRSPYLHAVGNFAHRTGRYRFLYSLLEYMVAFELLPLEWLAADCMRSVWDRLIHTMSGPDCRTIAAAHQFFETVTIASMGLPNACLLEDEVTGYPSRRFVPSSRVELRQALDTTFSSLLTVLCSIALVHSGREDSTGQAVTRRIKWILDATVIAIATRNNIPNEVRQLDADIADIQVMAQRGLWINFASCLLRLEGCKTDLAMVSLGTPDAFSLIDWLVAQYSSSNINFASILATLPSLVSSAARGTGRIWKDDGFNQLQRLVTALMTMSGCRLPHKLWTLKRLALESALEFAQLTGDAEHMAYAQDIEKKMQTQGRLIIMQSPSLKKDSPTNSGGFRWEEGIGEWVTCTPFVRQNTRCQQRKSVRALELLPTPAQSEDGMTDTEVEDGLPDQVPDTPVWEVTAFDHDDVVPQSSPIRTRKSQPLTSSLGKRMRTSSPKVVISVKRIHIAHSETPPIRYFPELPEDNQDGPRRSRRPRQEQKAYTIQRRRTRTESGLCHIKRPTYIEPALDLDSETSDSDPITDSSSQKNNSDSSPVSAQSAHDKPAISQTRSSRRLRNTLHDSVPDADVADDDETSDRDELGKTPARPQPRRRISISSRHAASSLRKQRPRARLHVADSEEGSEDELSFH
ncbi:Eukaryotic translation initiation factor 3 subunit CLU1 TIF31 [Pyrenophora seminiperda CCB06]|uniref:Eukaryotic translation initiation factor 3 subunit CLU1 TIF31 n=1 Tax=Pyrenophora seminiperda CCB06 TaxID=1302712 RepID=A0A3M7LW80_9PLEO|nr:Eukaryotic translation initiation factor 3 subunit CLU1 TIF31 [Pyrenophora seminiperda CCB06]